MCCLGHLFKICEEYFFLALHLPDIPSQRNNAVWKVYFSVPWWRKVTFRNRTRPLLHEKFALAPSRPDDKLLPPSLLQKGPPYEKRKRGVGGGSMSQNVFSAVKILFSLPPLSLVSISPAPPPLDSERCLNLVLWEARGGTSRRRRRRSLSLLLVAVVLFWRPKVPGHAHIFGKL